MRFDTLSCKRGRELVSLELDGESSELEDALLESHLAGCVDCRAFRAAIAPATTVLRSAPLERLERAIVLPPRRSFGVRAFQVGAAAAVVVVAGAASLLVGPLGNRTPQAAHATSVAAGGDSLRALQQIRRAELVPRVSVGKAGGRLPV